MRRKQELNAAVLVTMAATILMATANPAPPPTRPAASTAKVWWEDGTMSEFSTAGLPYVNEHGPIIVAGEMLYVQFLANGEELGIPRLLAVHESAPAMELPADPPPGMLAISYVTAPGGTDATVRIQHNFARAVAYDLDAERFREGSWASDMTNTCPVQVNVQQVKHWPGPVRRIFLHDFRLLTDEAEAKPCE
jgi:hypothetical protein